MTSPAEKLVALVLERGLRRGSLTLVGRDGQTREIAGREPGPSATVRFVQPLAARRALAGGSLGLAEAYMRGAWETDDLQAVLDLGIANMDPEPTKPTLLTPIARAWHRMRDNDVAGSKKNIEYHYDLGNDFYRLWLDPTMAYSSALFEEGGTGVGATDQTGPPADSSTTLTAAQTRKWDRMLDLLQPGSKDRLLEIGCGWGGFAIHAVRQSGCSVTGVTISEEQRDWAEQAVREAGLEDRIEIRLQDYRHVSEQFTGIASIEMIEAVGERWWPVFFSRLRELLAPGGAVAIQAITIEDARFEDYRDNPDFIQRYIFPGGMLLSPTRFREFADSAGLAMDEPHFFGQSYARTLADWRDRFEAVVPQVRALGFDERFIRMWRYYLAYCRAGFSAGTIDVMQVRLNASR